MTAPAQPVSSSPNASVTPLRQETGEGRLGSHTVTNATGEQPSGCKLTKYFCNTFTLPFAVFILGLTIQFSTLGNVDRNICRCEDDGCDVEAYLSRERTLHIGTGITLGGLSIIMAKVSALMTKMMMR